jgi:hypothetical protein
MPSDSLQSFSSGVTSAKTQSEDVFRAVNDMIAVDQLEDAAHATNLSESLFLDVLDDKSLAVWGDTLAKLEAYSLHLQTLTSPELTKDFVAQSEQLGSDLQAFGQGLKDRQVIDKAPSIPPGVATAFTEVGSLLIRYKAERDAMRIATAADPWIQTAFQGMAAAIGETPEHGIRGTVRAHWQGRLAEPKKEFKLAEEKAQKAVGENPSGKQQIMADAATEKKAIAENFLKLMQTEDAEDALLAALRRSMLSLASLHSSMVRGATLDARQFAQIISDEAKASREIYSQFQAKLKH